MTDSADAILEPIAPEILLLHARLDRAEHHYATFGKIWADYLSGDPHRLDYTNENDGTVAVRLRRAHPLPVELSLAFGELLYELRAALDNCLFAVAVLVSGQNPPPQAARLEWPIRFTRAEWKNQVRRYQDLPSAITNALEKIQPYQAECPGWNCLAILHELARVDRHRSMHGLGLYLSEFRLAVDNRKIEVLDTKPMGVVIHGEQLMRMRLADGIELSQQNFDLFVTFDVDISDVQGSAGPSGKIGRPWGSLDARLRALIKATREYTTGLIEIAADLAKESTVSEHQN